MTMDYLAEVEHDVDSGRTIYACPSHQGQEWHLAESLEDLRKKAKRTANAKKYPCNIYRVINRMDTGEGDSYLVVRKILDPGPKGEPHLNWILVDTREAAEMLRDVSQGPTPYFGATVEETIEINS
jgi:hypothetical protein